MTYQHLLVAVDTGEHRTELIRRAQQLARGFGAKLSVLSVLPPMPMEIMPADIGMPVTMAADADWHDKLAADARARLKETCSELGIADADIRLLRGIPDTGILDTAKDLAADLIVIGHRQHTGIASWFSHTEENVVGKAHCDVLTVALADF